jgi:hypothetical protein
MKEGKNDCELKGNDEEGNGEERGEKKERRNGR